MGDSEMDNIMTKLLEELESKSFWEDVEDLAAHSRSVGETKVCNGHTCNPTFMIFFSLTDANSGCELDR